MDSFRECFKSKRLVPTNNNPIPTSLNQIQSSFYFESLGDGIFLSHNLLNQSHTDLMELNGLFPTLYVRTNRTELAQMSSLLNIVPAIDSLASRITQQGFFRAETQTDELKALLFHHETSLFMITLLILPLTVLSEILFFILIKRAVPMLPSMLWSPPLF